MSRLGIWIKLYADLPYHPKLADLCQAAKLKPYEAVGVLAQLWLWWAAYCPLEFQRTSRVRHLLIQIGIPEDRVTTVLDALDTSGFLMKDPKDALQSVLPQFSEYLGALALIRGKDRERKRKKKAIHSDGVPMELQGNSKGIPPLRGDKDKDQDQEKRKPEGAASDASSEVPIYTKDPVVHHLLQVARATTKMPNRKETLIEYLTAAKARFGAQVVEQWLMDGSNAGCSVIAMMEKLEGSKKLF